MKNSDYENFLAKAAECKSFFPTNVTKNDYLDIIELVVDAYGVEQLEYQLTLPNKQYLFTAFRSVCMVAYLLYANRRTELYPLWIKMMDKSCVAFTESKNCNYIDMTLKDLCLTLLLMRQKAPPEKEHEWWNRIASGSPESKFVFHKDHFENMNNLTVYGAVGEFMRGVLGMTDPIEHVDNVLPWVLSRMDENGMFEDFDHAMLYDLTTRCQLEQLLWYGYHGKYRGPLEDKLRTGGIQSLLMQSATFQIPYGGRSNQFVHNEALFISLCEFQAIRHKKEGNLLLAGMFKRCAHKTLQQLSRYLCTQNGPKHIKNLSPQDSLYGIDLYGTFSRYMNCLAIFIGYGYLCADDTIKEVACPAEYGGFLVATSERFHKVFANCGGYSIEIETKSDKKYDAPGLGRLHHQGTPPELAISLPFTSDAFYLLSRNQLPFRLYGTKPILPDFASYVTNCVDKQNAALCTGWYRSKKEMQFLCDCRDLLNAQITSLQENKETVRFTILWSGAVLDGCDGIEETYTLSADGLTIDSLLIEPKHETILFAVPLLSFNGTDFAKLDSVSGEITVTLGTHRYSIRTDADIQLDRRVFGNRNGEYMKALLRQQGKSLRVHFSLV